jgi:hypothetical protein
MAVWHCLAVSDRSGEKFGVSFGQVGQSEVSLVQAAPLKISQDQKSAGEIGLG